MTYLQFTLADCSKSLSTCDNLMLYYSHLQSTFTVLLFQKARKLDGRPLRRHFIQSSTACLSVSLQGNAPSSQRNFCTQRKRHSHFPAFFTSGYQHEQLFVDLWKQMHAALKRDWIRSAWLVQKELIKRPTEHHCRLLSLCFYREKHAPKYKWTFARMSSEVTLLEQRLQIFFAPIHTRVFDHPVIADDDVWLLIFHMFACWQWVSASYKARPLFHAAPALLQSE